MYVQGLTGERLAQRLKWNPFSQSWQKRVETLDILTDNASLLVDTNGGRALFCYESGAPRQIVEVYEEGTPKYYYADATGAATQEPCNDSPEHFYYLYLPGSTGELNYPLFASTYEKGTTELTGVGTTAYYPAEMDQSQLPAGDNDSQTFAQEITGQSNALDNRPAGSREYWTNEAELIPYDEVQMAESSGTEVEGSSRWDHEENHGSLAKHQKLEKFVLVTVIPDPEGTDSTIYSPFRSRTQYMTTSLYFGYTAELAEHLKGCPGGGAFANCDHLGDYELQGGGLYDQIIPTADRPTLFNDSAEKDNDTTAKVAKNTAAYTLKSGEGLMLTGLGNRITYRFTEKLTNAQIQQGYHLKEISHIQQRGSDTVYMPGVQNVPVYLENGEVTWAIDSDGEENPTAQKASEPFAHTNATIWESYATMAPDSLGNHHQPAASGGVAQNPNCNNAGSEANLGVGKCDIIQNDGSTRHYFYYGGKLVDPHYENEQEGMSRYVLNPTAHFGVEGETQAGTNTIPATNPEGGKYDYTGVYSTYGDTGYFTEQANYTNTIDPELFVLVKEMVDRNGNDVPVPPDKEFTFTVTFDSTDGAMTDADSTLHYWKGNKDYTSALEWTDDTDGSKYKMPSKAPELDEYEQYLTDPTYRLKPIEPDGGKGHTYTVHLKANEAIVFYGLIAGTKFTVKETPNKKYPVVPGVGSEDGGYTQTGTIYRASVDSTEIDPETTHNRAEFTNRLETGALTVETRIKVADPDTKKEFGFTVTLTPAPGTELKPEDLEATKYKADGTAYDASEFTISWNKEGDSQKAEVMLKHGEKVVINGIPLDTTYTVDETNRNGYTLKDIETKSGNVSVHGKIASGKIEQAETAMTFVNVPAVFLPEAGGMGILIFCIIGALLIACATAYIVLNRKKLFNKYRR